MEKMEREYGKYFNPRPLAGATNGDRGMHTVGGDFNPRPLAGATVKIGYNAGVYG